MARSLEKGIPALHKYQSVHYFHFDVEPGASLVLTSDPWSYLYAWLSQKIKISRGKNRKCLERALFYAELSEGFYKASDTTQLPTKGTHTYYGMLNLVKCFISVKGIELEKTWEHHGIMLPLGKKFTVEIPNHNRRRSDIQIF